jgi:hypothetical protein
MRCREPLFRLSSARRRGAGSRKKATSCGALVETPACRASSPRPPTARTAVSVKIRESPRREAAEDSPKTQAGQFRTVSRAVLTIWSSRAFASVTS